MEETGEASLERLVHFHCAYCKKWWSIGDAPPEKTQWFCPWCGKAQLIRIPPLPVPESEMAEIEEPP